MRINLHENTLEKYITILTRNLRSHHGKIYQAYRKAADEIDELYETGNCDFNGIRDILLANGLTDNPNSYLTEDYLTQEELLQEKSLFGSMEGQVKKTLKAIDKQIKEFESVIPTIKAESEKLTDSIGGEEAFGKAIASYSTDALKKIVQAKASVELAAGLATVEEELKHAREILTDKDYLSFCKKVDDNTKLFGGSKGKLTAKDKDGKEIDVTSKTAGKVVDKSKEGNLNKKDTNNTDEEAKNESILNEEDVTEGLEDFKKKSEELGQALANAGQITEMLQNDPEMKKAAQAANVKFNSVLGVLAITGGVCKLLGNVVPGLGLIGTALASGSVLARTGKSVTKTIQNPNMSISQKILTIAPSVAASAFAVAGLGNVAKTLTGASAVGAGVATGLETGSDDSNTGSNDVDTSSEDTNVEDNSTDDTTTSDDTSTEDDTSSNDTEEETSKDDTDEASEEELGEPTIENSIAAQAKAKVGDILQRDDGTKVKLNQGDIDWAKKIVKDEPDMAEATVEETNDMDNPIFNTEEHSESSEVEDTDSDSDASEEPAEDTSNEEESSEEEPNDSEDSGESNSESGKDSGDTANDNAPSESSAEDKTPDESTEAEELDSKEDVAEVRDEIEDDSSDVDIRDGDAFERSDAARAAIFKKYNKLYDNEKSPFHNVKNPMRLHGACEGERLSRVQFQDDTQCFIKYADAEDPRSIQVFTEDGKILIDGGIVSKNAEFLQGVNKKAFWKIIKNYVKDVDSCLSI